MNYNARPGWFGASMVAGLYSAVSGAAFGRQLVLGTPVDMVLLGLLTIALFGAAVGLLWRAYRA